MLFLAVLGFKRQRYFCSFLRKKIYFRSKEQHRAFSTLPELKIKGSSYNKCSTHNHTQQNLKCYLAN